jgi:twitching motility two-component system response regulator PilH
MPVRKILVVDDSPTELYVLGDFLSKNGYQVITAITGEDAIAQARAERPDLILMDVVLPGINGFQATRTITRDEITRDIPVIMCTNKGGETDRIWGMRQGALDYMVKPIDRTALLQKISSLA